MAKNPQRQADAARRAKLTIQRRSLYLLLLFGVVAFGALFVKVYDITVNRHEEMQERAADQQTRSTTISASRGTIYDRNGKILAISSTADTVFLDPKAIQKRADELDEERSKKLSEGIKEGEKVPYSGVEYKELIAETLAQLLELEEEAILKRMEKTWSQYEVLAEKVDQQTADAIRSFIAENDTGKRIQGIYLETDTKRTYPQETLAAHVIGFLDGDDHGAYGLEAIYNEELEGTTGLTVTAKDANGQELMFQYEQYYDAEDGHSLVLTIDSTMQSYLEKGLQEMIDRYDAKNGAAGVILDVDTGAIRAIASCPTYDLNDQRAIYDSLLQAQLNEMIPTTETGEKMPFDMMTEEQRNAYNKMLGSLQLKQWRNKAVNDTYEPGSTYKILTLSAALEENKVNLNTTFDCKGSIQVSDWTIHCSRTAGHGLQTLAQATANSCNPAFITIGMNVGTSTYYQYMEDFGLFDPTGVDLQGEAVGVAKSAKNFTTLDLATYSFGQNFTVTPLQIIAAQAACINGGYLYTPYVVEKVLDEDGNVVSQHDATPVRQVISEDTSATVRQILEYVVADGTGRNGQVAGYRIGGKTGTADKANTKTASNPKGDVVVSFLCFAPADDPEIIMLLTLDTPSRNTGTYVSGGNMVAPTASALMADILPYLGYTPQYTDEDLSSIDATVPHVIGLTEAEAAAKLSEYGFTSYRTVGSGSTVTDQTPLGGAVVPASAEIILYMGAEKSTELCTVPNVIGMTATQVNKALTNAGLIMKTTGVSGTASNIKSISQSVVAGEQVPAGTVITVQMGQSGTTAD